IDNSAKLQNVDFNLGAYCLNSGRTPALPGDVFEFGPVTQNSALNELMELVKNKRIDNVTTSATVQAALWNITDGNGLTDGDKQAIAALPNNYNSGIGLIVITIKQPM